MADSNNQHPVPSIQHPVSSKDVLEAVDREALAREVLKLLREELRTHRRRLSGRDC